MILKAASLLVTHALGLGRSLLMARLPAPDDFGLFGMAVTVLAGLTALTSMGLEGSLVVGRFEGEADLRRHLDTVWSAELVRRALPGLRGELAQAALSLRRGAAAARGATT